MSAVELEHVGKLYGATRAITDVSLRVEAGEFLVLVGPSGCGKSTLLRMVAGLEEISEGELRIGGARANETPPKDRDIAMVFQSYALYPHMTARENMAFGLKVRRMPKPEIAARVAEAARMLELEPLLDRLPKAMSGGQRQRVAMGRALVRKPRVFLFDEPLSNLDAALRTQMRGELKQLHRRLGTTMIYVTHDQVEAMTLADRIAVMRGGVLQQAGPPGELFERPANRFVAGFLGSPSMNFLAGRIEDGAIAGEGFSIPAAMLAGGRGIPESAQGLTGAVLAGLRPHELEPARAGDAGDGAGALRGTVLLVEPGGWESHVHVQVGPARVVCRLEGRDAAGLAAGAPLVLRPRAAAVRLFAGDSEGRALFWTPASG